MPGRTKQYKSASAAGPQTQKQRVPGSAPDTRCFAFLCLSDAIALSPETPVCAHPHTQPDAPRLPLGDYFMTFGKVSTFASATH